jgi:hypothetical protein
MINEKTPILNESKKDEPKLINEANIYLQVKIIIIFKIN